MTKLTVAVDVDDVCADLLTEWLYRYNLEYEDNLTVADVDRWDLSEQVKPECGKKIYNYLRDPESTGYYSSTPGGCPRVPASSKAG